MITGYVPVIFLVARLAVAPSASEVTWVTDYPSALKVAQESKRPILAHFDGSDWCPNCVRLHSEVFDTGEFKTWAEAKVILLELDFPRAPTQSEEQKKQNRELLRKFSIDRYPTVVMIDADGKELGRTFYLEGGAKPWLESAEKALKGEVASKAEGADGAAAASEHGDWLVSWDQALAESKKTKKPILADFTGSDWCPWCIKLRDEVFDTPQFRAWARKNVVLLEIDFPKHKELSEELKKQNAKLRDSNNVSGLPTVVFFDVRGKKAGQLGYEPGGAEKWIKKADSLVKKARGGRCPMAFRALSLLALLALGAGCGVNVDEQTLHLRYDAEHDRLNVLVVSRGLFVTGTSIDKSAEQWIDAITRGDRCLVVTFFPFPLDLDQETTTPEEEEFKSLPLVRAISVKHGELFLDDRGRPSIWQCVRIDHLTSVLQDLNHRFVENAKNEAQEASAHKSGTVFPDDRTLALRQGISPDFAFLSRRGNALVLRMPLSKVGHRYLLEPLVEPTEYFQHEPRAVWSRWMADCLSREWSLGRTGEITEIVAGNPEAREQIFDLPAGGSYAPNLISALEQRHIAVAPSLDEAKMLRAFDEFCAQ